MDRFEWSDSELLQNERLVTQQGGVKIYNGPDKTGFLSGKLQLTTHRLIWTDEENQRRVIALHLSKVVFLEEEQSGFAKSAKIVCHLTPPSPGHRPRGPVAYSPHSFLRFSFKEAGEAEFFRCFKEHLSRRTWESVPTPAPMAGRTGASGSSRPPREVRRGIVGIERKIEEKHKSTNTSIQRAFVDLDKLMKSAKQMVEISRTISAKIRDKQGDISEDETVKFKCYLLSLGISDPVTRETHGSGDAFHLQLARQLSEILIQPVTDCGGMMSLVDVYCRVNRARGMELLSPEDLVNGCKYMDFLKLPLRLRTFDSGVKVVQLASHNEEKVVQDTEDLLEKLNSLTAEELAQNIHISVILAKERLLVTEKMGHACRDDSLEGLRFYPNRFLK